MTLVLDLKPQLAKKLHSIADERGLTIEQLLTQELESRYLVPSDSVFSSLDIGESDLNGAGSQDWSLTPAMTSLGVVSVEFDARDSEEILFAAWNKQ